MAGFCLPNSMVLLLRVDLEFNLQADFELQEPLSF